MYRVKKNVIDLKILIRNDLVPQKEWLFRVPVSRGIDNLYIFY